ncbi:hypothetical protein ACFSHT_40160 [Paraburkholderia silviterrae]|uniref:Uncharacterized protein n=1 Tax=Paraburkholderia silviterrae TaxID=2528715 RepID=A0A4R5LXH3_9BURK|nr:hypothetical protein [Paraburkholderia silviterrae]TDG16608.1 hypothetical protein EYW47_40290 [Paraburkholderia silviterrae]
MNRIPGFKIAGRTTWVAGALGALCLCAYGQTSPQIANTSTHGDATDVQGVFVLDKCKSGFIDIRVFANAGVTHGGGPSQPFSAFGFAFISGYDTCAQSSFGNSYSGPVQFSANDANGVIVPKSATASGLLLSDEGTDTLQFTMTANALGASSQDNLNEHQTISYGNVVMTIFEQSDGNTTAGTGTVTATSQTFGNVSAQLQGLGITLSDYKNHTMSVTR